MKILFDQNLSPKLAQLLQRLFPGSIHVIYLQLDKADDWDVSSYAANNGFALATKDSDFKQRSLLQGHPPKVILVTSGNGPTATVELLFRQHHQGLLHFAAAPVMSHIELP